LGGGSEVSVNQAIALAEAIAGRKAKLRRLGRQRGDVRHTSARLDQARSKLGYAPATRLDDGLLAEWNWIRSLGD
jgi:UDP-glucose 4-epimerase